LLEDGPHRETMLQDLAEIRLKLHSAGSLTSSEKAAEAVLAAIAR